MSARRLLPMLVVMTTTGTAALQMLSGQLDTVLTQLNNPGQQRNVTILINSLVQGSLILAMLVCTAIVIISGAARVLRIGRESELRRNVAVAPAS